MQRLNNMAISLMTEGLDKSKDEMFPLSLITDLYSEVIAIRSSVNEHSCEDDIIIAMDTIDEIPFKDKYSGLFKVTTFIDCDDELKEAFK